MTKQSEEKHADGTPGFPFSTPRRTITETDIVNFVNLVGLYEPIFIDMEFIKENMNQTHTKRFAPAPLVISIGMGLVAPYIQALLEKVVDGVDVGPIGGMIGIQARVMAPVFPGDTICVDGEARIKRTTDRGHTLVDLNHKVKNQRGEIAVDFTETIIYMPSGKG
jgi:acyl dehydratase